MKDGTIRVRQIEAATKELERKIFSAREAWCKKNPYPTWQTEEEWEKRHISPRRKHEAGKKNAVKHLEAKKGAILFDARMGKIDERTLYEAVKAF